MRNTQKVRQPLGVAGPISETTSVVILAAGAGRKSVSFGPVSRWSVARTPVLERQVIQLRAAGIRDIIVVGGFEAGLVATLCRRLRVRFVENLLWSHAGMAKSLDCGLRAAVTDRVVVIHGDVLFLSSSVTDLHTESSCLLDQTLDKTKVGVNIDGVIEHLSYGLNPWKFTGIFMLAGRELEAGRLICNVDTNQKLATFEILNKVIDAGGRLDPVYNQHPLVELNSHGDCDVSKNPRLGKMCNA